LCQCDCGGSKIVPGVELNRGRMRSCGCQNPSALQDFTGQQFGQWRVLSRGENSNSRRVRWRCRCACGTERLVFANHLHTGRSKSCGCARPSGPKHHSYKHGSDPALYKIWCNIIQRCENPKNTAYNNYGGRGIRICTAWRENFAVFARDMGKRPSTKHSIDRIDNDGDYSPDNCRWATKRQQMRNTRRKRLVKYNGSLIPLSAVAEIENVSYDTARWKFRDRIISR
jgi:hypothetical protein